MVAVVPTRTRTKQQEERDD